jgi:Tfp pilus assembly protein PilV
MAFRSPATNLSGFTIVEALLAGVVLAISVAGVSGALSADYQQTLAMQQTATAINLGRELQDEIASKPLANPSSGSTTPATAPAAPSTTQPTTINRSTFVAVGDYNGYTDFSSDLYTLGGTSMDATGSQNYCRSVSVTQGGKPTNDTVSATTDFAVVTVTVTPPNGKPVQISRVVTNYKFSR